MKQPLRLAMLLCWAGACATLAAATPVLTIDAARPTATVSPTLYGLMTEEINYSYDGGLYAELIRNRIFKDNAQEPAHWSLVAGTPGEGGIALDETQPIANTALTTCLRLDARPLGASGHRVGIANDGFWGIPVRPKTTYLASFYAKVSGPGPHTLIASIESNVGDRPLAQAGFPVVTDQWQKYTVPLTTEADAPVSAANHFVISTNEPGTLWFSLVSLFPPTFKDRPNGNRIDLLQMLVDMRPAFLRLPGGNYLEGRSIADRFQWEKTLGALEQRPGHAGPWGYRSSDGMGLLEYLDWCEDMHAEPLLAVYAGYSLNREHVEAGPALQPYVDSALAEIEFVLGDVHTAGGALRAKGGHPAPFALEYVEIGNEDGFDHSHSYNGRFAQFYDAIKAKYPRLQIIATAGGRDSVGRQEPVTTRTPDLFDEHYYRGAFDMMDNAAQYDHYERKGPKIFVGEWATREGVPTTNLVAALADAAWMTGMERNADLVRMSCFAPLFVNVNPGGMQWKSDLIGYDALRSYGSPSYHVQKMFSQYLGDVVLATKTSAVPTQTWQPPAPKDKPAPDPRQVPALFFAATKASAKGEIYLKAVNALGTAQTVQIELTGAANIAAEGQAITLSSAQPDDTNSIKEPEKIVPVTTVADGLGAKFPYTFPAYSVTVLVISAK